MKGSKIAVLAALLIILDFTVLYAQGGSESNSPQAGSRSPASSGQDTDNDGIPDGAEQLLGTNPHAADTDGDSTPDASDDFPLNTTITISESSTAVFPLQVTDARVEDNFFGADDHLEITLENPGQTDVALTDCIITIADKTSSARESYYVDLAGFTVPAGGKQTLHFDNGSGAGHFPGNTNGLYRTAADGLDFTIDLHAGGYKPTSIHVEKAPGTAEVAD